MFITALHKYLLSMLNRRGRSQQEIPKEGDPQAPNSHAIFDNLRSGALRTNAWAIETNSHVTLHVTHN